MNPTSVSFLTSHSDEPTEDARSSELLVGLAGRVAVLLIVVVFGWLLGVLAVRLLHIGVVPFLSSRVFVARDANPLGLYLEVSSGARHVALSLLAGSAYLLIFKSWLRRASGVGPAVGVFTFGALAFAYLPPNRAMFPTHDYLDSEHVLLALRGSDPKFFDLAAEMPSVMGGVPLSALAISDFNVFANLYVLLGSATAASLTEIVVRILGYAGAYVLLRRFALPLGRYFPYIAAAFATSFALAPYWPSLSPTVALQAPFFAGLLTLRRGPRSTWAFAAVVGYPFLSNFALGGFAVTAIVLIIVLSDILRGKRAELRRVRLPLIGAMLALLLSIMRPLHLVAFADFTSHRTDWRTPSRVVGNPGSGAKFLDAFSGLLESGYYHFASGQRPIVLATFAIACAAILMNGFWSGFGLRDVAARRFFFALLLVLAITATSASEMSGFTALSSRLPIPVQLARFYALLPLAWSVLGATSTAVILKHGSRFGTLAAAIVVLLVPLSATVQNHAVAARAMSAARFSSPQVSVHGWQFSTVDAYYNTHASAFRFLRDEMSREHITVVSFGIDPMKAAYAGLNTLDGYHFNYRLEHKRAFRQIIVEELQRVDRVDYFDFWGNRAYLSFSPDPAQSRLDFCAASDLGATHVVSRFELPSEHLTLIDKFEESWVYMIEPRACHPLSSNG